MVKFHIVQYILILNVPSVVFEMILPCKSTLITCPRIERIAYALASVPF